MRGSRVQQDDGLQAKRRWQAENTKRRSQVLTKKSQVGDRVAVQVGSVEGQQASKKKLTRVSLSGMEGGEQGLSRYLSWSRL